MDVTVIGYWGAYPEKNEATSGYLLQHNEKKILLDCGTGVLSQLQNYCPIEQLDAVIITHTHSDHMSDVYGLEYASLVLTQIGKRETPLDVYIYGDDRTKEMFSFPKYMKIHQINLTMTLHFDDLTITFKENRHEVPCCAIKATVDGKTFVYSSDTGYCPEIIEFSVGADVLIVESSFYNFQKGIMEGHLTAGEAGEIAVLADVGKLILTHLPHYGDHNVLVAEASEHYPKQVQLAYSGMKIDI